MTGRRPLLSQRFWSLPPTARVFYQCLPPRCGPKPGLLSFDPHHPLPAHHHSLSPTRPATLSISRIHSARLCCRRRRCHSHHSALSSRTHSQFPRRPSTATSTVLQNHLALSSRAPSPPDNRYPTLSPLSHRRADPCCTQLNQPPPTTAFHRSVWHRVYRVLASSPHQQPLSPRGILCAVVEARTRSSHPLPESRQSRRTIVRSDRSPPRCESHTSPTEQGGRRVISSSTCSRKTSLPPHVLNDAPPGVPIACNSLRFAVCLPPGTRTSHRPLPLSTSLTLSPPPPTIAVPVSRGIAPTTTSLGQRQRSYLGAFPPRQVGNSLG